MKKIIIINIFFVFIFIFGCEDSTKPPIKTNGDDSTLTQNYYIFYPLSQNDGWRPEHSGLFFYSFTESNEPERNPTESIVHLSSVGKNGTLVFQYEYLPDKFWVRYSDGTVLPIPFPQSDQSDWDYFYTIPPHIELSGDGEKAVFFATKKRIDGTKPEENNLVLIIMDLPETTIQMYELNQFVANKLSDDNVNFAEIFGKNVFINEDGTLTYFTIKGKYFINDQFNDIGYYIVQFSDGTLNKYSNKSIEPIELLGYDEKAQYIYYKKGTNVNKMSGNSITTNFVIDNFSNPNQFVKTKSEVVIWTDYGIELYNSITETKITEIVSWDTLKMMYPDVKNMVRSNKLSISPDGGLIVFGFDQNTDPPSYDLYAIRRNGKDLKRLVPNTPIGMPVVSWGLK